MLSLRQEEQRVHVPPYYDKLQSLSVPASRTGSSRRGSRSRRGFIQGRGCGRKRVRAAAGPIDTGPGVHNDDYDPDHPAQGHAGALVRRSDVCLSIGLSLEVLVCPGDAWSSRYDRSRSPRFVLVGGKEDISFVSPSASSCPHDSRPERGPHLASYTDAG